jgi:hypothetical protein
MLHLLIFFMMQDGQSFLCSISHSSLEHPTRGGGGTIDHLVDMVDTISHRLLVYDHTYVPEIRVCSKQPRGFDEEWGLAITQRS